MFWVKDSPDGFERNLQEDLEHKRAPNQRQINDSLSRGGSSMTEGLDQQPRSSADPGHPQPESGAGQQQKGISKTDVALEECLQLLKGPTDERR